MRSGLAGKKRPYIHCCWSWLGAMLLLLSIVPVWASNEATVMTHTQQEQEMDEMSMGDRDHGVMPDMAKGEKKARGHGAMMSGRAQGGPAPADARDPHAYSGGYSFESGQYALPGSPRMKLADEYNFSALLVDRLEQRRSAGDNVMVYDLQGWYGRDYDRLVLKAEGELSNGNVEEASTELLWSHAVATYWDAQLGLRYESGETPARSWLAFAIQGLAPYWFEVDVAVYLGEEGRTALSLEAEYEILLTQRWILQPRIEAEAYGKDDAERGVGSGLSELSLGLRLRYEMWREFAPYIGVEWAGRFGGSADYARAAGRERSQTAVVAGLRFWF